MSTNTILATTPLVTTNFLLRATGTTIGNSLIFDNGTNVGIGNTNTSYTLDVSGTGRFTGALTGTSATFTSATIPAMNGPITLTGNANSSARFIITGTDGNGASFFLNSLSTSGRNWGIYSNGITGVGELAFYNQTNGITALTILPSGNVGIGTSSPTSKLEVYTGASDGIKINSSDEPTLFFTTQAGTQKNWGFCATHLNAGDFALYQTNSNGGSTITASSPRIYVNASGYTKISNNGSFYNRNALYHEIYSSDVGNLAVLNQSNATGPLYGIDISFSGFSPNNGSSVFASLYDTTGTRFAFLSNGGLKNYQANNVNLSDERTKKEIAPLESYWEKFKAIKIVKFKYKDQTHDDYNIGVIAQQVESIAPEFIDSDGWGNRLKLDEEEPLKSVYTSDLQHAAIKVLQECMTKIEEQQALITSLQSQINELKIK